MLASEEAEKECKTNPAGNGYRGTQSKTFNGLECIDWASVTNMILSASIDDIDISQSHNYCRRLATSAWDSPSCVASLVDQMQI